MMYITRAVSIREEDISEEFIRSGGPGGQNVNKVSTGVQLRFDVNACTTLPSAARARLLKLAGKRATQDGFLVIEATAHRTQKQNREDARQRLALLIRKALHKPKPRKKTTPTKQSREKRLQNKRRIGEKKISRKKVGLEE